MCSESSASYLSISSPLVRNARQGVFYLRSRTPTTGLFMPAAPGSRPDPVHAQARLHGRPRNTRWTAPAPARTARVLCALRSMVRAGPGPARPRGQRSPQAAGRRTVSCVRPARHGAGTAADAHARIDRLDGTADGGRAPQRGNSMIASRPPAGRFRRVISPPCARAIMRAMARPRPAPPVSSLRDGSSRS